MAETRNQETDSGLPPELHVDRNLALAIAIHLLRFQLRRVDAETVLNPFFDKYQVDSADRKMILAYIHARSFFKQWLDEHEIPEDLQDRIRDDMIRNSIVILKQIQILLRYAKNVTAPLAPLVPKDEGQ